jgi:hypothetical protein
MFIEAPFIIINKSYISFNGQMVKLVYPFHEIIQSNKKKQIIDTCHNLGESPEIILSEK